MWRKIMPDASWKWLDLAPGLRLVVWSDEGWCWSIDARGEPGEQDVTILRGEETTEEAAERAGMDAARTMGEMVVRNVEVK